MANRYVLLVFSSRGVAAASAGTVAGDCYVFGKLQSQRSAISTVRDRHPAIHCRKRATSLRRANIKIRAGIAQPIGFVTVLPEPMHSNTSCARASSGIR